MKKSKRFWIKELEIILKSIGTNNRINRNVIYTRFREKVPHAHLTSNQFGHIMRCQKAFRYEREKIGYNVVYTFYDKRCEVKI